MKLADAEAMRLRRIMAQLPEHEAAWLHRFVSRHTEPCRRWPSDKDQRDAAIRVAFEQHYAALAPTAGGVALANDLARWRASGWTRHAGDPLPPGVADRDLALHHILLARDELIGARQVYNVIVKTRAGI